MTGTKESIGAIVLAAGMSVRMGQPKMLLPWGSKAIIQQVVDTLIVGGIQTLIVVGGAVLSQIVKLLGDRPVQIVFNPRYSNGEMLNSLQTGLETLDADIQAVFIVLGDQPQILASTVSSLTQEFELFDAPLIIPSYQMRRGHPWLIRRELWDELKGLQPPATMRDFLQKHASDIHYLNLDTPTILADLDTPEDYQKSQPGTK